MSEIEKIKQLKNLKDDGDLFLYDLIQKLNEELTMFKKAFGGIGQLKGAVGDKGDSGVDGKDGIDGKDGKDGRDGINGKRGPRGAKGDRGKPGKDGSNGKDGRNGRDGLDGDRGLTPKHKWQGTTLMFQKPNGKWGKAIDLVGPMPELKMPRMGSAGGGSAALEVQEAGTKKSVSPVTSLNFSGGGVSVTTDDGQNMTVDLSGVGSGGTEVAGEIPTGTVNGVNTDFTLANTPVAGTDKVFVNGARVKRDDDYTLSGTTISFTTAPPTGSNLLVDYTYA